MLTEHGHESCLGLPVWVWITIFAMLMTLKYFPGLENETLYSGNVFQILSPDAFSNDPFRGPETPWWQRPTQLSLFYGLVWLSGDIWLDDRFVAIFYLGLVIASLVGIDRIARHFGLNNPYERLILLMFFLKDHQILTSKVLVAHHQDVNPSAMAIPAIIWLFYAIISQRHFIWTVVGCALITLISIRLALCVCVIALISEFFLRPSPQKWISGMFLLAGLTLFSIALMAFTPSDDTLRLAIWEKFVAVENNDADPFAPDGIGRMWLRFPAAAAVVALSWAYMPEGKPGNALKVIISIAVSIFLLGGLYINFAPDAVKIPLLISFVPARISGWLQNLCYIGLISGIFIHLRTNQSVKTVAWMALLLGLLFIAGPGHLSLWTGFFVGGLSLSIVLFIAWRRWLQPRGATTPLLTMIAHNFMPVLFMALLIVTNISYAQAAHRNADAWSFTAKNGIYGNNPSAIWKSVTPYILGTASAKSILLTYQCRHAQVCDGLVATRAFASRSGLAMPIPAVAGGDFDKLESWVTIEHQEELVKNIAENLVKQQVEDAASNIAHLKAIPNILIVPAALEPNNSYRIGPYIETKRIETWIILTKEPQS